MGIYALEDIKKSKNICSGGYEVIGNWGYNGNLLYQIHSQRGIYITSISNSGDGNIIIGNGHGYIEIWALIGYKGYSISPHFQPHRDIICGIRSVGHSYSDSEFYISSGDHKIKLISLKVKGEVLKEMDVGYTVCGITKICME